MISDDILHIIIIIEVYYLNNKPIQAKFVGDKILFKRQFSVFHNPSTFFSCLELIVVGAKNRLALC